jgi:hypothetical protein
MHRMSTAPRMSITFTEPQMAFLKVEAERLGISVADLIRRIVDRYRDERGQ